MQQTPHYSKLPVRGGNGKGRIAGKRISLLRYSKRTSKTLSAPDAQACSSGDLAPGSLRFRSFTPLSALLAASGSLASIAALRTFDILIIGSEFLPSFAFAPTVPSNAHILVNQMREHGYTFPQ
jgi:hypothetical protein